MTESTSNGHSGTAVSPNGANGNGAHDKGSALSAFNALDSLTGDAREAALLALLEAEGLGDLDLEEADQALHSDIGAEQAEEADALRVLNSRDIHPELPQDVIDPRFAQLTVLIVDNETDLADGLYAYLQEFGITQVRVMDSTEEFEAYLEADTYTEKTPEISSFRDRVLAEKDLSMSEISERNINPGVVSILQWVDRITNTEEPKSIGEKPMVIIKDNDCPGLGTGIRALKKLRSTHPAYNHVDVVCTGNHEIKSDAQWQGLDAIHVTKPFSRASVKAMLEEIVSQLEKTNAIEAGGK